MGAAHDKDSAPVPEVLEVGLAIEGEEVMGYEVNMFLGERRRYDDDDDKRDYFQVVATIDLCKPYSELERLSESAQGDPVYMYASDGNRRLVEDCYGRSLVALPAAQVLEVMRKEMKANKNDYDGAGYRRYVMALPMLEVFVERFKNPCVVLYGH